MPFVALLADGSRFCMLDHERRKLPFLLKKEDKPRCQDCGSPLFPKYGVSDHFRPHFSHYRHEDSEHCVTISGKRESVEHLESKAYVRSLLKKSFSEIGIEEVQIEIEFAIPEAKRRADVMVVFPGGFLHAHEIQLSPISLEELQARTESYHALGIQVTWYLGRKVQAEANLHYFNRTHVECFGIAFEETAQNNSPASLVF